MISTFVSCHAMGYMTGKIVLGIYLVNIPARMVISPKLHYTCSFVIQRITWKNCLGIMFLQNLESVTQKNAFGINFATISGWSVLQTNYCTRNISMSATDPPLSWGVGISSRELGGPILSQFLVGFWSLLVSFD